MFVYFMSSLVVADIMLCYAEKKKWLISGAGLLAAALCGIAAYWGV